MSNGYTREMNQLIERLRRQRWRCRRTKGGHWRCLPPDKTQRPVFAPCSPGDHRWRDNLLRDLRRSGAQL
jgi:hypothetical protein